MVIKTRVAIGRVFTCGIHISLERLVVTCFYEGNGSIVHLVMEGLAS